jgi:hypothetical protein
MSQSHVLSISRTSIQSAAQAKPNEASLLRPSSGETLPNSPDSLVKTKLPSSEESNNNRPAHNRNDSTDSSYQSLGDSSATGTESNGRSSRRKFGSQSSKLGLNADLLDGSMKNPNLVRIEVPLGKPIEEVYEGVHDGPVLGSGISGIVRLVKHRATQVSYAVKCLDLALIDSEEGLKQLKEEIYIMCQLVSVNKS